MKTAKMMYRTINNEAPNYLTTLFERLSENSVREFSNITTDLQLPLLKLPMVRGDLPMEEHDYGIIYALRSRKSKPYIDSKLHTTSATNLFANSLFTYILLNFILEYFTG